MKVSGEYVFEAPIATVWQALFDPEVLAKTLPGCDRLEREGDRFTGEINVKMGPVQGKFQGTVDIADIKELESYRMVIDGRGPAGFVKATPHIKLGADGARTRLVYDSDVQVGGKVASVGQRLLDASSRAIVKQSLEGLDAQIKAIAARGAGAASAAGAEAGAAAGAEPGAAAGAGAGAAAGAGAGATADAGAGSGAAPGVDAVASAGGILAAGAATAPGAGAGAAALAAAAAGAAPATAAAPAPAAGAASSPSKPAAPAAPSQAAFALGVAKEVTKELFPIRTVIFIVGAVILVWAVYSNWMGR